MCIALWSLDHPQYALILGTNRDEYLHRPTKDAQFHDFDDKIDATSGNILSGRDVKAGGTWFGLNRSGKVALLTNITEPVKEYSSSRGYLVSSFLLSDLSHPLENEIGTIIPQNAQFAGFNLLLLAPVLPRSNESLHFDAALVTNNGAGGTISSRPLSAKERFCGGVSNGIDGAGGADWPKLKHATQEFDAVVQALSPETTEAELTGHLFDLLAWRSPEPVTERSQLRNTVHVAPVPITTVNDSNIATTAVYGTRLSTVVLIRRDGQALFIERDVWKLVDGEAKKDDPPSERRFRFQVRTQADC